MERITSGQVAARLGVSKPTVRALIARGELQAVREERGERFRWLVNPADVASLTARRGSIERRTRAPARLAMLEAEVASLSTAVKALTTQPEPARTGVLARERDDLRAEVARLQEALARSRTVVELQEDAAKERSAVVEHLLAAVSAADRADERQRLAVAELEDAVAAFSIPGHLGQV